MVRYFKYMLISIRNEDIEYLRKKSLEARACEYNKNSKSENTIWLSPILEKLHINFYFHISHNY